MKKIINFDSMFEKLQISFIEKNYGKYSEQVLENKMVELYNKFGNKAFDELGGLTPNEYYKTFTAVEKIKALSQSIDCNIPVSDFLLEAIISDAFCEDLLVPMVRDKNDEKAIYAINVLADFNSIKPLKSYIICVIERSVSDDVIESMIEQLSLNADLVKDAILAAYPKYNEYQKAAFAPVLSYCKNKDDRILPILLDELLIHPDDIAQYVEMVARYGDERALDTLYKEIEREDIKYSDFVEIRFAIEKLGGEYTKERDFSNDEIFKKVRKQALEDRKKQAQMFGGK